MTAEQDEVCPPDPDRADLVPSQSSCRRTTMTHIESRPRRPDLRRRLDPDAVWRALVALTSLDPAQDALDLRQHHNRVTDAVTAPAAAPPRQTTAPAP